MQTNDSNAKLHLLKPEYKIYYGIPSIDKIKSQLKQILNYLEKTTPAVLINKKNNLAISSGSKINEDTIFVNGDFRLTSYEWGITYAGMLNAGEATKDQQYIEYVAKRLKIIADLGLFYLNSQQKNLINKSPVYSLLNPKSLDDSGAMCAAMIKAKLAGLEINLPPLINNLITYIRDKEFRLSDGTLARNRPYPNTLWIDDLYMSVSALAQIGKLTRNNKYFDDASNQILQFSKRMYNYEIGLYIHGWVQQMKEHPKFYWGRANGWAIMAMIELLDVMPKEHNSYNKVLEQLRAHIKGLSICQSGTGFWHQLLDRSDTYLETSCTAMFTYSLAKAINAGYIDKYAFAPIAILGWNAVASKINNIGQVEGTCVGTGMGFDPAFYYYRPVNVFAAHGYGSILLAGAEIIYLIEGNDFEIIEGSLQLKNTSTEYLKANSNIVKII